MRYTSLSSIPDKLFGVQLFNNEGTGGCNINVIEIHSDTISNDVTKNFTCVYININEVLLFELDWAMPCLFNLVMKQTGGCNIRVIQIKRNLCTQFFAL